MSEIAIEQRRADYSRALEAALVGIIAQLREMPEIQKVILFGSYAAGRRDLFTDLDLLIVMDTDQDFIHRTTELYGKIHTDVDLDLLVYTPDEIRMNRENGFIRDALRTGKVVYEKKCT